MSINRKTLRRGVSRKYISAGSQAGGISVLPAWAKDSDEPIDREKEKWLLKESAREHFAQMKAKEKKESRASVELDYKPLQKMIKSRKRK